MSDLISRQDAIDAIYEHEFSNWCDKDEVSDILNDLPTVDVREVVHGEWIKREEWKDVPTVCNQCGHEYVEYVDGYEWEETGDLPNFCPHCGCKMTNATLNERERSMKKLFISCPMKGRTEENIKETMHRMHKAAEAIVGEELEVIPSYIEGDPPKDRMEAVWCLGESIKKLSEADYIVCIEPNWDYDGCTIEVEVAIRYNITRIRLPLYLVAPDIHEVRMEAVTGCVE